MSKFVTAIIVGISMLAVAFFVLVWNFNQPPRTLKKIAQVKKGMTKTSVTQILGNADHIYLSGTQWAYTRPLSWPILKINFDTNGIVSNVDYDY